MIYESKLFPDRLKAVMEHRDLNTVQLGKKLGINPQTVRNWRGGQYVPNLTSLAKLAEALKTTVDYLCGGLEKQPPPEKKPRVIFDPERGRGCLDEKRILTGYNQIVRGLVELRSIVDTIKEKI